MIPRLLKNELKKRVEHARSVYVFGPRQSGKTTLVRTTFPELPYCSLEDPDTLEFAKEDPRGFLNQFEKNAIIDEPQRCPELFSYLQSEIDLKEKKFILTSSQNFLLMEKVSQSLAGRISLLQLLSLSKSEIEQTQRPLFEKNTSYAGVFQCLQKVVSQLLVGGYPEVCQKKEVRAFWYSDYVKTYLERDVRQIINVQDLSAFHRFLKLCAGRSGTVLNKASLAQDCSINEMQCARWLSVLEQSGIVYLLRPFYMNFNKRIIKSPKLYFNDTGLLCHLLGITTEDHCLTHPLFGQMIETYVVTEIRKHFLNKGIDPELYFWRDHRGAEIDLILMDQNRMIPIEIKSGQTIKSQFFEGLEKWKILSNASTSFLFYGGDQIQTRQGTQVLPIDYL